MPNSKRSKNKHHLIKQVNEGLLLQQIKEIRKQQPRCGGRKLFIMLEPFFRQHYISMGRDNFFDLLRQNKLLVRKTKRAVYTTNTKHHFHRYSNLVKPACRQGREGGSNIFWFAELADKEHFRNCNKYSSRLALV